MSSSVPIVLQPAGLVKKVRLGTPLRDLLFEHGVEFPCGGRGRCYSCRVHLLEGHLPESRRDQEHFSLKELQEGWRLACQHTVEGPLTLELAQWEERILTRHKDFVFTPGTGLGIAVDLGTTTLAAQLIDLEDGATLAVETALNPQGKWGADVMSRIHASLFEGQAPDLKSSIRKALAGMIDGLLCSPAGKKVIRQKKLQRILLVGNTVMHHLFCGYPVESLAGRPFESPHGGSVRFLPAELGWDHLGPEISILFLPCIGGFVGSDILAGILAVDMHRGIPGQLLMDLGTNGELVIGNGQRLYCASTAAGPAFEGGRISCGMRAVTGAVSEVRREDDKVVLYTLGGGAPKGICGSGLVDAIAVGLDMKSIRDNGRLSDSTSKFHLNRHLFLTQKDIRETQLAKAAIAAGVRILRKQSGMEEKEMTKMYMAGAFGNYIQPDSARRIGLLPFSASLLESAGNTALLGAKRLLFTGDPEEAAGSILRLTKHIPLATDPAFQETYVEEMSFAENA